MLMQKNNKNLDILVFNLLKISYIIYVYMTKKNQENYNNEILNETTTPTKAIVEKKASYVCKITKPFIIHANANRFTKSPKDYIVDPKNDGTEYTEESFNKLVDNVALVTLNSKNYIVSKINQYCEKL